MGFLTVNGMLMTFDEYKQKCEHYKTLGLRQYSNLHSIYEKREIPMKDLHWGEEIEYHLYTLDPQSRTVKLSCDASNILESIG